MIRLRRLGLNVHEELVFLHIAALFISPYVKSIVRPLARSIDGKLP